jgi:hypothetical protein
MAGTAHCAADLHPTPVVPPAPDGAQPVAQHWPGGVTGCSPGGHAGMRGQLITPEQFGAPAVPVLPPLGSPPLLGLPPEGLPPLEGWPPLA